MYCKSRTKNSYVLYYRESYGGQDDIRSHFPPRRITYLFMTSFTETALSVFNSTPVSRPGRLLKALPEIVRRFLPHARYSSFLETLVAASHPPDASSRKTPSLTFQDEVGFKDSTTDEFFFGARTGALNPEADLHTSPSCADDLVFRILYKTHGKFAWMNGQIIKDVRVLKWLGGECLVDARYM